MGSASLYFIHGVTIYAPDNGVSASARSSLEEGLYEFFETNAAREVLRRDAPVIELGAGIGVVSCYVNRLLADPTQHVAVEMHPGAFALLEQNRVLNGCTFRPLQAALSYKSSPPDGIGPDNGGEWDPSNRMWFQRAPVRTTVGEIADDAGFDEFNLIADIEGMELQLFENEIDVLRERALTICLEIHPHVFGSVKTAEIIRDVQGNGFELAVVEDGCVFGFRRKR